MKTIDLLVQELPALGGFPDGAVEAGFLCSNDTLYFVNKDGDCPSEWRISMKYDVEDRWVEVTREQYEAALAAKNDGWIDWGGGDCPVDSREMVDVIFGHGGRMSANIAECWRWSHDGTDSDIIAYRLHQTTKAEQVRADAWDAYAGITEADDESDLDECIGQTPAPVWNGEGLPPIGCVCERSWAGDKWLQCEIIFTGNEIVLVKLATREAAYRLSDVRFRPTRSEADRKRDAATNALIKILGGCGGPHSELKAKEIYDLVAAGKVPGMKLED